MRQNSSSAILFLLPVLLFFQSCTFLEDTLSGGGEDKPSCTEAPDPAPDCSIPGTASVTINNSADGDYKVYTMYGVSGCQKVNLSGVSGKKITVIYSNLSETNCKTIAEGSDSTASYKTAPTYKMLPETQSSGARKTPETVAEFNAHPAPFKTSTVSGSAQYKTLDPALAGEPVAYTTGDAKSWYYDEGKTVAATLRAKVALDTESGAYVHVWVENAEWNNPVTQELVDQVASKFADDGYDIDGTGPRSEEPSIYTMVTRIVGKPWGEHAYSNLISKTKKDIHILYYDIDGHDSNLSGVLGYFWAVHNYAKSNYSSSNEELMFFMDSDYLKSHTGEMLNTLAHEFQHMVHFYQRTVVKGIESPTWLNEMMSMTIEDMTGPYITGKGPENYFYNFFRDPENLLTEFDNGAGDYEKVTSFGTYLVRNYGGTGDTLWTKLVQSEYENGLYAVSDAINNAYGATIPSYSGFSAPDQWWKYAFLNWGASIAMDPSPTYDNIPALYAYPAHTSTNYFATDLNLTLADYDIYENSNPRVYTRLPGVIEPLAHVAGVLTTSATATYTHEVKIGSDMVVTYVVSP